MIIHYIHKKVNSLGGINIMSNTILTKRIGTTTYKVNVHFNQNATETMEEKFLRIISDYPLANGEKCGIIDISQMSRSA